MHVGRRLLQLLHSYRRTQLCRLRSGIGVVQAGSSGTRLFLATSVPPLHSLRACFVLEHDPKSLLGLDTPFKEECLLHVAVLQVG